ncbi:MAG: prolyl oligopeptidase family serine peptidase, partial [Bacteroidota bacterium]
FILNSEKSGWNHFYQYDFSGKLIRQLTSGNWDVDQFYGIDEKKKLFYISTSEINSTERYVYACSMDGKTRKQLTKRKGWNSATFNADYSYFLLNQSAIHQPPYYALCDASGKEVRVLEDNQLLKERLTKYDLTTAEITNYKNAYGESLNAFMMKPKIFDATKKYPVLMYVYGGPGHQLAVNRWMGGNYFWYQLLAAKGYMIVCVDGRGTGFKGEAFKKSTYLQLGKYEIEDQIFVAKELGKLPYIDAGRIGIWGWSFGGYMASLGISKGADVFKTAIAVAPVTNWRYYDNIYTERFMRTPQENGKSYDDNSPMNHVEKIKGNYLIIHGTADDNVHFQNAVEMVNTMINKGVNFDSEFYPNKNHGIGGAKTRLHLYERMTRFILEKL